MPHVKAERIRQELNSSSFYNLRHLRVKVDDKRIILSGRLKTYHERQQAIGIALGFESNVEDCMQVV
jgi:osmotically-inducible protein OsmY